MTKVINLLGGSGLGKSTTAAGLFYHFKLKGINCELVTEYVKSLAWRKETITPLDQLHITGEQTRRESILYGKVDYIITDSPILLAPIYDEFYNKTDTLAPVVFNFIKKSDAEHHYFVLNRNKPFDPRGRFENETTAKEIDQFVRFKLDQWHIPFTEVHCPDEQRVQNIMDVLKV